MTSTDPKEHERCVAAWLARHDGRSTPSERIDTVLLVGLRALWERARPVLGEVTLGAIFRRAIETAQRRHPELNALGIRIAERGSVEMSTPTAPRLDLTAGTTFLLVEVLRVISRLSAGALTRPLHVALSDASVDDAQRLDLAREHALTHAASLDEDPTDRAEP
jgi:hypothetical protein